MSQLSGKLQPNHRTGFSLIEILLSIGILGIGLIMVLTLLPVGADWTRRAVDDSAAQNVALNAFAVLQMQYPVGSTGANNVVSKVTPGGTLIPFPGLNTDIPITPATPGTTSWRCYQWGGNPPFPADPTTANYFWTALIRATNDLPAQSATHKFDVYILVFKKGDVAQQYTAAPPGGYTQIGSFVDLPNATGNNSLPVLFQGSCTTGSSYNTSTRVVQGAVPGIGEYGIGATSGTVFRQSVNYTPANPQNTRATQVPPLLVGEKVIYAPPADGISASPLIYVFQTTLTY